MNDFTRAHLERIFIVTPLSWVYKILNNPLVFTWRWLPEIIKEPIRSFLGWPTWADHRRIQEEIRKRYELPMPLPLRESAD